MNVPRIIMVATDFSPEANHAVHYAVDLACALQARCIIAHAYRAPLFNFHAGLAVAHAEDSVLRIEIETRAKLEELRSACHSVLPTVEWRAIHGDAREALSQLARAERVELIILGAHGRPGAARLLLGSVAEYLLRHAPCAVLKVSSSAD